jgi:hypothetical protein
MSALIFVALAGAWAVYLVPKALKQQEDADAVRSVESFSDRLRVIDPRRAVQAVETRMAAPSVEEEVDEHDVVEDDYVLEPVRLTRTQVRLRRAAARKAAERRRRVLGSLVLLLVAVLGAALAHKIPTVAVAAPSLLIVAWLVACRLMVKQETATRTRVVKKRRTTLADEAMSDEAVVTSPEDLDELADGTEEIPAVGPASAGTWEPVPMTLPTYVDKAAAARTVRTIDLDSTGVWSSGRNAGDSELAREAESSRRIERESADSADKRHAAGS